LWLLQNSWRRLGILDWLVARDLKDSRYRLGGRGGNDQAGGQRKDEEFRTTHSWSISISVDLACAHHC